jgi:hypothetical protein
MSVELEVRNYIILMQVIKKADLQLGTIEILNERVCLAEINKEKL